MPQLDRSHEDRPNPSRFRWGVPTSLLSSIALGTLLNPLNSSMIAVALVPLQHHFAVGVATVSWLVSAFYVAAAVAQPVMGRLVDLLGARRLFIAGLLVVCLASLLAPFAPGFWWLVGARILLAVGTSTAFPAALVLIQAARAHAQTRTPSGTGPPIPPSVADDQASTRPGAAPLPAETPSAPARAPAAALAFLTVAASISAALGPVIGGFLVAAAGWQAVFLVNVPITLANVAIALRILPSVPGTSRSRQSLLRDMDVAGAVLFTGFLVALLGFVLSIPGGPDWFVAPLMAVSVVALVAWERRCATPFLDIRGLAANRDLTAVLAQQAGLNLVFYSMFFGLPLWLGSVRALDADLVGLLTLPIACIGILMTPLAAGFVRRRGSRAALVVGSLGLVVATVLIRLLTESTPLAVVALVAMLFGLPGAFNNLGLQSALYESSPVSRMGSSGGLFQTFRYLGAISATSVLGAIFEHDLSTAGLHLIGLVTTGVAVVLLVLAILLRPTGWRTETTRAGSG